MMMMMISMQGRGEEISGPRSISGRLGRDAYGDMRVIWILEPSFFFFGHCGDTFIPSPRWAPCNYCTCVDKPSYCVSHSLRTPKLRLALHLMQNCGTGLLKRRGHLCRSATLFLSRGTQWLRVTPASLRVHAYQIVGSQPVLC